MSTMATLPIPLSTNDDRFLPVSIGTLDRYIRAVQAIPPLTEAEERYLARKFREEGDLDAARRLILANLRYVVLIARQYFGYGLPEADLIQEGNIGLMKAVRRFDPDRGVRLITFAIYWIRAEIHEFILKNWRLVKIATTKAQKKLFFNLRKLLGNDPLTHARAAEIAATLDVKPEEVTEMHTRFTGGEIALEAENDADEEAWRAPIASLPDPAGTPEEQLAAAEEEQLTHHGLRAALEQLDARSRAIVTRRWLTEPPATLQELADHYGISAERIRQIEAAALKKLRAALAAPPALLAPR
ncbi:MAG: RNA polymerase sigma factor RpoH [Hydrogenophilus sp.]|nr:RNA polymerase sigma factor RpoH [Hydrogenophilus sp.]